MSWYWILQKWSMKLIDGLPMPPWWKITANTCWETEVASTLHTIGSCALVDFPFLLEEHKARIHFQWETNEMA